jgi:putative membrane protein
MVAVLGRRDRGVFVALRGASTRRRHASRESPGAVLQRRLSVGEITPPQYEERRALMDRDTDKYDDA